MKRILTIIACLSLLIIPLLVFIFNDDVRVVNKRIEQTNNYIKEKNIDDRLFSNILQSKLDNSLIYNIDNNEDLIIYKNSYYIYKNTKLNEINYPNYKIENNVEDALNNEIGTMILTKGYYKEFDGGNGYFIVEEYLENDNELIIENNNAILFLKSLDGLKEEKYSFSIKKIKKEKDTYLIFKDHNHFLYAPAELFDANKY